MTSPLLIGGLGTTELLLILAVVVLLFGASKLPELARGSGRALRIFKAETKGLVDGDDDDSDEGDDTMSPEEKELQARQKLLDAEQDRIQRERITRERGDDTPA